MKKILILFVIFLLLITLISCDTDSKYYEIISMPRDVEYGLLTSTAYTEKGQVYLFEEMIEKEVKKAKWYYLGMVRIRESVLSDDKVFNIIYLGQNVFTEIYSFAIGYFDVNTKSYNLIKFFETTNYDVIFRKIGDYLVLQHNDAIEVYNPINCQMIKSVTCGENWIPKIGRSSFGYMTSNGFVLYDEYLNEYMHETSINMEDYEPYKHIFTFTGLIIYYCNENHEYLYYDCLNETYISNEEYYERIDSSNDSEQTFTYENYDTILKIQYYEMEYEYTIEEFRNRKEIVRNVETLCETEVYFYSAFEQDSEFFIVIGNQDSFFGLNTPGRTLPLVFRIDFKNDVIEYVGSVGAIYFSGLTMYKLD